MDAEGSRVAPMAMIDLHGDDDDDDDEVIVDEVVVVSSIEPRIPICC